MPFSARAGAPTPQPSSKSRGIDVLLVGCSDAGQTTSLAHGRTLSTHTSMQPNLAVLPRGKTKTRLVDIPGHARRAGRTTCPPRAACSSSSTVARSEPAVAGHLHEVLAVALVAAKRDLAPCVRAVSHRQARVDVDSDGTDETKGGLDIVGARGAPFRLAEWEGGEIAVLACSLREKDGDGLAEVREWIDGLE